MNPGKAGRKAPASLGDAIETFLDRLRHEGLSEATVRNYRADLAMLARQAGNAHWPARLERVMRRHLDGLAMAERTWNRHLSTLRRFADFLVTRQRLPFNPLSGMSGLRVHAGDPRAVDPSAIERLLDRIACARDRALFGLLWDCGLRVSEALQLRLSDVDARAGRLHVGADGRTRLVRLTPAARRALADYLAERATEDAQTEAVFLAKGGHGLSYAGAHRAFRQYVGDSGITMQRMRARAAATALDRGATLRDVQQMLGHRHVGSTARYDAADNPSASPRRRSKREISS